MPSDEVNDQAVDAAIDAPASSNGLPTVTPDVVEQELGSDIDNIVPTRGYGLTPTVGLGGSAGSIPALVTFFQAMPADSGLVFVVVLHLSPEHESTLAELLGGHTAMPVVQAQDGMVVEADHVYVIPPRKHLSSVDGHLRLSPLEPERGRRMAVDVFFRTLADTHGAHSAAVVLSGADGDGAIGLKRVKERGGLTIAQDPGEAEHEGMPRSAIDTNMVDWVLKADEMPARLLEFFAREKRLLLPPEDGPQPAVPVPSAADRQEANLRETLAFLQTRTGRDFSYYKRATVLRRLSRRMQINGVDTLGDYLTFLRTHPGESGALLQDMLISVTNFFRDRDAFTALETHLPLLFRGKGPKDTVRVWVAACASGEEAYSLAMLLHEHARRLETPPRLQVFATDLAEDAVRSAREGVYPAAIATDVSEERLARFFTREHRGYRVRRELREAVLFAQHDLLKDSPFSKLDLVTCRNLLIYLDRDAQARALDIFHFSLLRGGLLFLGTSESVGDDSELFTPLDKKYRLYAARPTVRLGVPVPTGIGTLTRVLQEREQTAEGPVLPAASGPVAIPPVLPMGWPRVEQPPSERAAAGELYLRVLAQAGPAVLIINGQHEVVHLSGAAGRYLQFGGGDLARDLFQVIHPMLRLELRAALYRAVQTQGSVEVAGVPVEIDGQTQAVDLRVSPARELAPDLLVITLTPRPGAAPLASAAGPLAEILPATEQLERELERLKVNLRDVQEQHEVTIEEHQAGHEELQAINEELRSASEELETSREELQSLNEELTTVNTELKSHVDELGRANSDLHNLMNATAMATVFLDRELNVVRYTPEAVALFNLIPTDLGRPLGQLKHRVDYPELEVDAQQVLRTLATTEREVGQAGADQWFLARLVPYRSLDDRIQGVVLTLVDISERRRTEIALHERDALLRIALSGGRMGTWRWDLRARRVWGNAGFLALWGLPPSEESCPISVFADCLNAEGKAAIEAVMSKEVAPDEEFDGQLQIVAGANAGRWVRWRGRAGREMPWIVNGVSFDVTEQRLVDERLRASEEQFRSYVAATTDTIYKMSADWSEMRLLEGKRFLADTQHPSRSWLETYIPPEDHPAVLAAVQAAVRDKRPFGLEHRIIRADGTPGWTYSRAIPLLDARGEISEWIGAASDVTERKAAAATLEQTGERLRAALAEAESANASKDHFLAVLSHELRTPLMPINMALGMLKRRDDLPEAVHTTMEMIRRNVDLEARFIDDLLDVTRISRGKMEIVRAPMDLHEALERAVEVVSADIEAKGQRLTVNLEAGEHRLSGDSARLQQAVWNLLKNASKFTPEGGTITLHSRNEEMGWIVVEVIDSGIGMEAEALARVFQPFEQANAEITREFGGLGLGLAIAKGTVEAHGGTLSASSPGPGQGATFTVTLPLDPDQTVGQSVN